MILDLTSVMSGRFEDNTINDEDYQMKENESDIPRAPGSPTPIRRRRTPPPSGSGFTGSPSSSPRRNRGYGDRYIPNRTGVNLHAAFNLAQNDVQSQSNDRTKGYNEIEHQKSKYYCFFMFRERAWPNIFSRRGE